MGSSSLWLALGSEPPAALSSNRGTSPRRETARLRSAQGGGDGELPWHWRWRLAVCRIQVGSPSRARVHDFLNCSRATARHRARRSHQSNFPGCLLRKSERQQSDDTRQWQSASCAQASDKHVAHVFRMRLHWLKLTRHALPSTTWLRTALALALAACSAPSPSGSP